MDDPRSAEPGRRGASFTHRSVATLLSRRGCRDAAGCCASGCAHVLGLGGQCLGEIGALPGELRLGAAEVRSEEHTSELQSQSNLVCRLLLEKKKTTTTPDARHSCIAHAVVCWI